MKVMCVARLMSKSNHLPNYVLDPQNFVVYPFYNFGGYLKSIYIKYIKRLYEKNK